MLDIYRYEHVTTRYPVFKTRSLHSLDAALVVGYNQVLKYLDNLQTRLSFLLLQISIYSDNSDSIENVDRQ